MRFDSLDEGEWGVGVIEPPITLIEFDGEVKRLGRFGVEQVGRSEKKGKRKQSQKNDESEKLRFGKAIATELKHKFSIQEKN